MKQLILIRHAKSDWGNANLSDFDRPLNERGKRDAPVMAQRLVDKKITIDAFVASPAKRAAKTAKIFAEIFNRKKEDILFIEKLYLADPPVFFDVIASLSDKFNSVAVFSHNNGLTDFANLLTDLRIDNIPTCGIFAVSAQCNTWADFKNAPKEFLSFDYPKSGFSD
jgi:phosphohistidine phosphatase